MRKSIGPATAALQFLQRWGFSAVLWSLIAGTMVLWVSESQPFPGENAFRFTTLASLVALALLDVPFFQRRAGEIKGVLRFIIALVALLVGLSAGRSLDFSAAILAAGIPPGLAYLYAHQVQQRAERVRAGSAEAEIDARYSAVLDALERVDHEVRAARQGIQANGASRPLILLAGISSGVLIGGWARRKSQSALN